MNKPVRTRLKDKTPTQRTQKAIIIANGIAAACMFLSWLAQNFYQSELGSTKSKIESDVGFVNSEMTKAIQWMVTFQTERKKDKPDTEIILNSAIGYAETVGTIIETASRVDPSSPVLTEHLTSLR